MYQHKNPCLDTYTKILKTLNTMATSLKELANIEGVTSGSFNEIIHKCTMAPPRNQIN